MTEVRLGVVMDPIADINVKKDSTFAILLEAQRRGWQLRYMEQSDLFLRDGVSHGRMRSLTVRDEPRHWFALDEQRLEPLDKLDVILMRKDPPFDLQYLYSTHLLELAEQSGVIVVNRPRALRDANEKLYTAWFPQCCPPTLVTRSRSQLKAFLEEHRDLILKPLDAMGGVSVFRLTLGDLNTNVIIETLSRFGERLVMAQRFVPEVLTSGDKRILLIEGEPVPYALARIPAPGEVRANLAVGGGGRGVALTARDRWICEQLGQTLRDQGLLFVGLDVIGDYLTEINVTSPTCIRELDTLYGLNISAKLLDRVEVKLAARHGH